MNVLASVALFAVLRGVGWLFGWISYHAVAAHHRVKRCRFQAKKDPS